MIAGVIDPLAWGPALCRSTATMPLEQASVIWINRRWMVSRGIDLTQPLVMATLEAWLLREFAFRAVMHEHESSAFSFGADRYGATGRVAHGGSGRAMLIGRFQVKGVGPTSLVGRGADWFHSHGCLWMEEAIREVILGELFAQEMGEGVIPTIAIIDTGLNLRHADGSFGERRALSIRPFAPRIAHLQRAYGFQPFSDSIDTTANRVQREDTWRVRGAWRAYGRAISAGELPDLPELFERIGRRAAFCHVWKLSHGGFYASNITLDGQLIDFGSATALDEWRPQPVSSGGAWFGAERESMSAIAHSLCFHSKRYAAARPQPSVDQLMDRFDLGYAAARGRQLAHHCGFSRSPSSAAALDSVIKVGRQGSDHHKPVHQLTKKRALPRHNVARQNLQGKLFADLVRSRGTEPPSPSDVEGFINRELSAALRVFPQWTDLEDILAQWTDGTTTALIERSESGSTRLRVIAPRVDDRVLIFGVWCSITNLVPGDQVGSNWHAEVDISSDWMPLEFLSHELLRSALAI